MQRRTPLGGPTLPSGRRAGLPLFIVLLLGASLVLAAPEGPTSVSKARSSGPAALQGTGHEPRDVRTAAEAEPGGAGAPAASRSQEIGGLAAIDRLVASALREEKLPGCVVSIGRRAGVLFQKAYGARQIEPERLDMTEDTVFDLASLTKPIATATSLLILADRGKLHLDDPVAKYVPAFARHDKGGVTLRHLLIHVSGLPAETGLDDYRYGHDEAIRRIAALEPRAAPGVKFIYSDIGFLILEEVIRKVSGRSLASFSRQAIFEPLGMTETGFLPPASLRRRAAPTELRDGAWMAGTVHDPRAFRLGGIAGHAGLFSTVADLTRYARALLGEGELDGVRVLSREKARAMLAPHDVPGGIRALGWDMQTAFSTNRGETLSRRAVGHGGFTGTVLWIDPASDLFVLFLSNRVHPDGKGSVNGLAREIGTLAGQLFGEPERLAAPASEPATIETSGAEADLSPAGRPVTQASHASFGAPGRARVEAGIDVLRSEGFRRLAGSRIALVTNESARAADGARTLDLLREAPGVKLVALFAPEHGLGADLDRKFNHGVDARTGLPVYSLYGGSFAPTSAMMGGIDAVVFDLQDAGARFFTYASTLHRTLAVAAERGLRAVVLDRPNPIDGVDVEGPLARAEELTFVNHHPLPIRHGMTLGELAEMIDADEHLGAKLEVVRMRGWRRAYYYDETALPWISPSPNLCSVAAAVLYPGLALVEGSNVSVGRGTATPFEVVGAPWIDDRLLGHLERAGTPGVEVSPARFTPASSTYAHEACIGVRFDVLDRKAFDPVRLGVTLARALHDLYADRWHGERIAKIFSNEPVVSAILSDRALPHVESMWAAELDLFKQKRKKYLLYTD